MCGFSRKTLLAAAAVFLLLGTPSAVAGEYTFRLIADSTGPFTLVSAPSSFRDDGMLVFLAAYRGSRGFGIYASDGTTTTTIADTSGPFTEVGGGVINADGMVSFWAEDGTTAYIFKGDGASNTLIADTTGEFRYLAAAPAINADGRVAFCAQLHGGEEGIYVGDGTTTETIVDTQGPFSYFFGKIGFDAGDTLAFWAALDSGHGGIFTSDGETTTTIADTTGEFYRFDSDPDMTPDGIVAFAAELDCSGPRGVFVGDGDSIFMVADDTGPFDYLRGPEINTRGTVAFYGRLDSGNRGIFTGPDPESDKVIMTGDELFGAAVELLMIGDMNNLDEISFNAILSDGRGVVAVATPIPEPAMACPLLLLALVAVRRR
jgi:hypothetical protein